MIKNNKQNKASRWLISLNFTYSDCISRLAFEEFILNNDIPRLVTFPNVIDKIKIQFCKNNLDERVIHVNPFKFLIFNKSLIKDIIIVSPSYLSIFYISIFKLRKIRVISVIHNHPKFKSDLSIFKDFIGKLIVKITILLSDNIIFTAPHIKLKWDRTIFFKFFNLSKKCKSFKRLFAYNDLLKKNKTIKNYALSDKYNRKLIDIYSWGRSTPYKDLSILKKVFNGAPIYLNKNLGLNIIHYGITSSSQPFLLNYENSNANLSIINRRPSMEEIEYIHNDADYIIFPYIDMSQSGPMRLSRELGSCILVPILDGAVDQLSDYENKYLFNPDKIETLFNYINHNFKK
tara:strand:- start:706 stop:1743 length:1038 start_codon:yes stop_codon:yes gene_type:complete